METRATRKLAAVLAADVVGYSRMMGADEAGTHARLKTHRSELVDPSIAHHRGRIVKTTGDGLLVEFASVVDAVECAVEVQRGMARRNQGLPEERQFRYRIGVNIGDVIVDGDDIFGDGVNIAARLETLAEPGGVCISGAAHEQLKARMGLGFDDLGPQSVKNIAAPVRVLRVLWDRAGPAPAQRVPKSKQSRRVLAIALGLAAAVAGAAWIALQPGRPVETASAVAPAPPPATPDGPPAPPGAAPPAATERASIAVLPFANLSNDAEQAYFADGIAEDILTALSANPRLRVIARNSSFRYKGQSPDIRAVGRELGARYVLEGSVRRVEARVRVTAQLIDASDGAHLWAERYDRPLTDLLELQDDVTERIVAALGIRLGATPPVALPPAPAAAAPTPPADVPAGAGQIDPFRQAARAPLPPRLERSQAHQLSLEARREQQRGGRDGLVKAREMLQQAVATDPSYVFGLLRLASVQHTLLVNPINTEFNSPALAQAMIESSEKAVALDPDNAVARAIHSGALTTMRRFDEAIAEARKAQELNGGDQEVLSWLGTVTFVRSGAPKEAIAAVKALLELDPYPNPGTLSAYARALYLDGQYGAAAEVAANCLARVPQNALCLMQAATARAQLGEIAAAEALRDEFLRQSPNFRIATETRNLGLRFRRAEDIEHTAAGLRKAGFAE